MKILLISITLLATATLFWFCKQPKYTAGNFPDKQLRWGSGGGFTGQVNSYVLLENGQLFQIGKKDEMTELKKSKASKAKKIFEAVKSGGLTKPDFQHPSNIYSFLEFQEGDIVQRITWGDPKYPVDEKIKTVFAELTELVKK